MKRQIKSIIVVAAALASVAGNTLPVSACGGRGGGMSRGFSRPAFSRPAMNYSQPTVSYPSAYAQPTYSQPIYSQPIQSQVTYQQPTYPQPTQTFATSSVTQSQRVSTQRATTLAAPTLTAAKPTSVAQVKATPAAQPTSNAANATSSSTSVSNASNARQSALQALVSIRNEVPTAKPAETPVATPAAAATATIPEFTAASATSAANHVGTWQVSLPGNQSVQLTLESGGTFSWTATKNGKANKFDGQYRLTDGRLTLVRSADLQQMTGNWTAADAGFTFKLDGTKTGGLNFKRS